jgi:hypothetical protein
MKKKKVILLAISLMLVTIQASAQFTTGPKAGLNVSDVHFNHSVMNDDVKFRNGLNVGVFGNYHLNDRFDVQAELLYSQQGYKNTIPVTDVGGTTISDGFKSLKHYLNIPVLIKFYPIKRLYLEAGPQVGLRLGHHYSTAEKAWDDILNESVSGKIAADFALAGGVGIRIGNGFSVNARYCHSLSKESGFAYKNRAIQFSFAYDLWHF